jgi:ABC-type branched-subunit amino acid transport system substrate-binding protein
VLAEVGDYQASQQQTNEILLASNVPNIAPAPISTSVFGASNAFIFQGLEAAAGATVLADAGAKKISVAYTDVPAASLAVTFNQIALKDARGLTLLGGIPVPLTATDLAPEVTQGAKGTGVSLALEPSQAAQWLVAAKEGGITTKLSVSGTTLVPSVLKSLGKNADGLVIADGLPPVTSSSTGVKRYNQEMKKYEPKATLDEISLNSWLGTWAFAKVAGTISGPITRASVLAAFGNLTNFNVFGLLPSGYSTTKPFNFPSLSRVFNQDIIESVVKNGKIVQTSGWEPIFTKKS